MNVIVATSERAEPRARPQMPWPLVQPLPIWVPRPTNKTAPHRKEDPRDDATDPGYAAGGEQQPDADYADEQAAQCAGERCEIRSHESPSSRPARSSSRRCKEI